VHNFVDIDAVTVGLGLEVTISACIKEDFVFLVFFWVQHVVAFLEETNIYLLRVVIDF
jgi:hypothetical protein